MLDEIDHKVKRPILAPILQNMTLRLNHHNALQLDFGTAYPAT